MRKWGITAMVTAMFAACSPFSSSSEDPRTPTDASTNSPEADGAATSDAATLPPKWSCKDAPTNLFCEDFSSSSWDHWNYPGDPNPFIQDAPDATAHLDSPADAPSPPIATFEFPGHATDGTGTCGYAWVHDLIDLTASPREKVNVAFDMRLAATDPSDTKEAVALVLIKDSADVKTENYLMVHDPKNATIYEQWTTVDQVKTGTSHRIGDLSEGNWVRIELTIDAKNQQAGVALDGVAGSLWSFGQKGFGPTIAKVLVGIGYSCTTVGGIAQFDNVLVTSN